MHFVIYCLDKPDHQHIRAENRAAHLEHLSGQGDRLYTAGPLTTEDGSAPIGSVLIIDCPDRAAAEAFAAADPYAQAGLFGSVEITPWRRTFPKD